MIPTDSEGDSPAAEVSANFEPRRLWRIRRPRWLLAIGMAISLLLFGLWAGAAAQRSVESCRRMTNQSLCLGYLQTVQELASTIWQARLALADRVAPSLDVEADWREHCASIDQILSSLHDIDRDLSRRLHTSNRVERLRSLWGAVKVTASDASPAELDLQFSRLLRSTRELAAHVIEVGQPVATDDAAVLVKLIVHAFPTIEDELNDLLLGRAVPSVSSRTDAANPDADVRGAARIAIAVAEVRRAIAKADSVLVARRQQSPLISLDMGLHRFLLATVRLGPVVEPDEPTISLDGEDHSQLIHAVRESLVATRLLREDVFFRLFRMHFSIHPDDREVGLSGQWNVAPMVEAIPSWARLAETHVESPLRLRRGGP